MAHDHDVLHLQALHGEFKRGGRRMVLAVGRIGRHQIGDVAHDKQFARPGVEDRLRRRARIAAGDHHRFRRLPLARKIAVAIAFGNIATAHEAAVTGEKMVG